MSILSGYGKFKRYVLTDSGYKLCSQWTSSNTVHFDDGKTAQTKLGAISGITDSLTSTNSNIALSAKSGKNLQDQITSLNADINTLNTNLRSKAIYVAPANNSKALNVTCSRANYDSTSYFIYIYGGRRIVGLIAINGQTTSTSFETFDHGYNWVKLHENGTVTIEGAGGVLESNGSVRTKISLTSVRDDYRAIVIPLSATAASGAAKYTASWATS